jgi:anhydro-N-acetylmuramic acid kinase
MKRWYIGISSGRSLMGVDAALVCVDGYGAQVALRLEHFVHAGYGRELRELLWHVQSTPTPELRHLATLHRVLGETYAIAVRQVMEQSRVPAQQVLAVGCAGLEVWHDTQGRYPANLTLGMIGVIAERTGLTVLSDFSSRDIALGGQGLPMTALVDALLFHDPGEHRLLVHLGSVATVVALPAQPGVNHRNVIGFQAAPCTLLLDGLMRLLTANREHFDNGGKNAVQGRCLEPLLERWLQDSFFKQPPPKCVSRSAWGSDFLNRAVAQAKELEGNLHDVLCTMTHFVARAILQELHRHLPTPPGRVLLSGRGTRNGFLWHLLEQNLGAIPMEKTDAHGIPCEARQAIAHAGLAALTMDGVPANLPSVTGASGARVLGQLTPGAGENWSRCLSWMARQAPSIQTAAA